MKRVTLQRPSKGKKAAPEPIGTPVVDWGPVIPPPPPPAPGPKGKPWRALREGRPNLLEPLPEAEDIWTYKRRAAFVMTIVWIALIMFAHSQGVSLSGPRWSRSRWGVR